MIDSIRLVFHNIHLYPLIYEYFIPHATTASIAKGSNLVFGVAPNDQGQVKPPSIYQFHAGSDKFLPIVAGKRCHLPSWDYSIHMRLVGADSPSPSVEVDFSLPKFFWGTNVFQFVGFPESSSEAVYSKLITAIRQVQLQLFNGYQLVRPEDIEIARIDLCYNQYFQNKAEALDYQLSQFQHMRALKSGHRYAEVKQGHGSNWIWATKRYTFKCYHKGDEFKKHDFPKLQKALGYNAARFRFRPGQKKGYDLTYLQSEADRVLRYEITFRRQMISYLTLYNTFSKIEADQRFFVTDSNLYRYTKKFDAQKNPLYRQRTKTSDHVYNHEEFLVNHTSSFFLRTAYDRVFCPSDLAHHNDLTFSYPVFRFLFDYFWSKVGESQIDSRASFAENLRKVQAYQDLLHARKKTGSVRKGTPARKGRKAGGVHTARLVTMALLSTFTDVRILKDHLPSTTYERLMADMSAAGLPKRTDTLTIARPQIKDYSDYVSGLARLINPVI